MHHGPQDAERTHPERTRPEEGSGEQPYVGSDGHRLYPNVYSGSRPEEGSGGQPYVGSDGQIASHHLLGVTARRRLRGTALCGFRWPQIASHRLLGVKRSATGQAVLFRRHQPRD